MTSDDLLLSMVFKIAFLKTMLSVMSTYDLQLYIKACKGMMNGDIEESDVRNIDELFRKFEDNNASGNQKDKFPYAFPEN